MDIFLPRISVLASWITHWSFVCYPGCMERSMSNIDNFELRWLLRVQNYPNIESKVWRILVTSVFPPWFRRYFRFGVGKNEKTSGCLFRSFSWNIDKSHIHWRGHAFDILGVTVFPLTKLSISYLTSVPTTCYIFVPYICDVFYNRVLKAWHKMQKTSTLRSSRYLSFNASLFLLFLSTSLAPFLSKWIGEVSCIAACPVGVRSVCECVRFLCVGVWVCVCLYLCRCECVTQNTWLWSNSFSVSRSYLQLFRYNPKMSWMVLA